jgi:hypothetical protein
MPLRRLGIAPDLNEDIEHNAILVDGAPEIMLHAPDADENREHQDLWGAATGGGDCD